MALRHHPLTPKSQPSAGEDFIHCGSCGRTFIGESSVRFCDRCAPVMRRIEASIEANRFECDQCGKRTHPTYGRNRFCSPKCARAHRAAEAVEMARAFASQLNRGAAHGVMLDLYQYLADRDGPSCSLCDKRVDLELSGTDDRMKPSVDHIVPRSKGGSNDLANLALAHLACNVAKGNRAQDEQLRLIG